MRMQSFIIAILIILTSNISLSQTKAFVLPDLNKKLFIKTENSFSFYSYSFENQLIQNNYSFSNAIKQETRPMLCKMEDNIHKRFNVWITFRAGSDEEYRKINVNPIEGK